ncbi:matrixin family metalloprotease [Rhodococcus sp. X156]|uniref:matrixin family metalloprotease n=1 Tax=Rhodococcus sp. X156 TaxID=2499145 RepID=UPI000FD98A82|nr:matrixin family metalloprotease [Rhodococcus sp. X156]
MPLSLRRLSAAASLTCCLVLAPTTVALHPALAATPVPAAAPAPPDALTWHTDGPDVAEAPVAASQGSGPELAVSGSTAYRLNLNPDSTVVRWDACRPIHYRLNLAAQPDALGDVQTALQEITAASGLIFVHDGPSTEIPQAHGAQAESPLLIAMATAEGPFASELLAEASPHTLGIAGWGAARTGADEDAQHWQITSAYVVINAASELRPGSGAGLSASRVRVLMHEVAHAVGLSHVSDRHQVMYPVTAGQAAVWGPGDLAGLARVGTSAGCIGQQPPAATVPVDPWQLFWDWLLSLLRAWLGI